MTATTRLFAVALTIIALASPTSVVASRPLNGTGESTLTGSDIVSVRQAGDNLVIEQHNTRVDVGAFTGDVDEHLTLVVHPGGTVTFHADAVLSGTYPACGDTPVTQSIRLAGQIAQDGQLWANFATTNGAAVPVQGTVDGTTASLTSTFEISYHC